jgi:hypothetical protein
LIEEELLCEAQSCIRSFGLGHPADCGVPQSEDFWISSNRLYWAFVRKEVERIQNLEFRMKNS